MSAGCNDTLGSNTRLVIYPEPDCAPAPKLHILTVDVAAVVGATQISVVLDSATHTATDKIPLSPGTLLKIGTQEIEVVEPPSGTAIYILSIVPQLITVKRLKAAITVNTNFTNYCFLRTCLTSNNIDTSTESVDNSTNCTGNLFTKLNVGYGKMIKLAGFNRSKDYAYYILKVFGRQLKTFWFALDYDGRFFVTGQFQGTDPSVTDGAVKNIVKWTMDGEIQQIDYDGSSYVETAADLVALEALRANYGFGKSVGVQVIPG